MVCVYDSGQTDLCLIWFDFSCSRSTNMSLWLRSFRTDEHSMMGDVMSSHISLISFLGLLKKFFLKQLESL